MPEYDFKKLICNFVEITLRYGCFPEVLPFPSFLKIVWHVLNFFKKIETMFPKEHLWCL